MRSIIVALLACGALVAVASEKVVETNIISSARQKADVYSRLLAPLSAQEDELTDQILAQLDDFVRKVEKKNLTGGELAVWKEFKFIHEGNGKTPEGKPLLDFIVDSLRIELLMPIVEIVRGQDEFKDFVELYDRCSVLRYKVHDLISRRDRQQAIVNKEQGRNDTKELRADASAKKFLGFDFGVAKSYGSNPPIIRYAYSPVITQCREYKEVEIEKTFGVFTKASYLTTCGQNKLFAVVFEKRYPLADIGKRDADCETVRTHLKKELGLELWCQSKDSDGKWKEELQKLKSKSPLRCSTIGVNVGLWHDQGKLDPMNVRVDENNAVDDTVSLIVTIQYCAF